MGNNIVIMTRFNNLFDSSFKAAINENSIISITLLILFYAYVLKAKDINALQNLIDKKCKYISHYCIKKYYFCIILLSSHRSPPPFTIVTSHVWHILIFKTTKSCLTYYFNV